MNNGKNIMIKKKHQSKTDVAKFFNLVQFRCTYLFHVLVLASLTYICISNVLEHFKCTCTHVFYLYSFNVLVLDVQLIV